MSFVELHPVSCVLWQFDKRSRFHMQEKTYGPQDATNMNTYKLMKVGAKKYKVNGSNTSIENPKAKKRFVSCYKLCSIFKSTIISNLKFAYCLSYYKDDYEKGLKSAYPEDYEERDLDHAVMYSTGGGMPHGRLAIGDGAFRKSVVVAAAKRRNIKPANSMSYQNVIRRNQFLEKELKNYNKHMRVSFMISIYYKFSISPN
jgi:hypothetical protein